MSDSEKKGAFASNTSTGNASASGIEDRHELAKQVKPSSDQALAQSFVDTVAEGVYVREIACNECGEVQALPSHEEQEVFQELRCHRCNAWLLTQRDNAFLEIAALSLTAFVLFLISNWLPLISVEFTGKTQTASLLDGVAALVVRDYWLLGSLVLATIFFFPLLEILALCYLYLPLSAKRIPAFAHPVLHWLRRAREWNMLEIFLLSVVVSAIKIADMANLRLEMGAYCFLVLVLVFILIYRRMDLRQAFLAVSGSNRYTAPQEDATEVCFACKAQLGESVFAQTSHCPRCGIKLCKRKSFSMQRTTALLVASAVLYIPANLLPIMSYTSLGLTKTNTILSGVLKLVREGFYFIAAIVFIASIVVPLLKILLLAILVVSVKFEMVRFIKARAAIYRAIEIIGRWSMVDVFVVTIFVALVQFDFAYTVEPEAAIIVFAGVVMLSMMAADSFDPRLMWDQHQAKNAKKNSELSLQNKEGAQLPKLSQSVKSG